MSQHRDSSTAPSASTTVFDPDTLPFDTEADDHAETPAKAFSDIKVFLEAVANVANVTHDELKIYDPYYCKGTMVERLTECGFSNVYNRAEDCYAAMDSGKLPKYDVLVTNPPYSGDHMERLLKFCISRTKPFCLLVPNFVLNKPWYKEGTKALGTKPVFLCPRKRYSYLPPEGLRHEKKTTAPFESFWVMSLGAATASAVSAWNETEGAKKDHARLAFGFKKRRGVPGFTTSLDADGWLFGTKEAIESSKQHKDPLALPKAALPKARTAKMAKKLKRADVPNRGGIMLKAQGPKGLRMAVVPPTVTAPCSEGAGNKRQQKKKRKRGQVGAL